MIQKDAWNDNESQALVFSHFLLRSTKYSLFNSKRVILVEEFPNALLRDPSSFHNIIKKCKTNAKYPVVFIISDSVKGESVENSLFPKDLQASLKLSNISFNPVAPTMMMKVLNRVGASYPKLNKSDLEAIVVNSMGDIRNAINSLQFLCISDSTKQKSLHAKKKNSGQDPLESQEHSLKRDSSLFLFHALGKILYCKRDPSLKSEKDVLPGHMKCFERDTLLANAEEVYQKTAISAEGFTLFLQENYIVFTEDINVASDCSQWLSEADVISNDWNSREAMNEYLVSLSARGLMFCIKSCNTGKRWRPLHKPQLYDNVKKVFFIY
ncbi:Cell cycle checkpoint protein RAD17, partial [Stegodyphus mimosarum]